jgi:rubrerythrin
MEECMKALKGTKTHDTLKAAFAGGTHEYTDMYPGTAKQAREAFKKRWMH